MNLKGLLVGAVGIVPLLVLNLRHLATSQSSQLEKIAQNSEVRYTAGTRAQTQPNIMPSVEFVDVPLADKSAKYPFQGT